MVSVRSRAAISFSVVSGSELCVACAGDCRSLVRRLLAEGRQTRKLYRGLAVPPERLPEFVAVFQEILVDHGTFASFYGHAGPGRLHVRPLADTKTVEGVETVRAISNEVSNPAIEYGGSVSGEYGDGRLGVTADTVLADRIAGAR